MVISHSQAPWDPLLSHPSYIPIYYISAITIWKQAILFTFLGFFVFNCSIVFGCDFGENNLNMIFMM